MGGKVISYGAEKIEKWFEKDNATVTTEIVNGGLFGESGQMVKLTLGEVLSKSQRIRIVSNELKALTAQQKKIVMSIYCSDIDGVLPMMVSISTTNSKYLREVINVQLKNGLNEVEISLNAINFDSVGIIQYFAIQLGDTDEGTIEPVRTI